MWTFAMHLFCGFFRNSPNRWRSGVFSTKNHRDPSQFTQVFTALKLLKPKQSPLLESRLFCRVMIPFQFWKSFAFAWWAELSLVEASLFRYVVHHVFSRCLIHLSLLFGLSYELGHRWSSSSQGHLFATIFPLSQREKIVIFRKIWVLLYYRSIFLLLLQYV